MKTSEKIFLPLPLSFYLFYVIRMLWARELWRKFNSNSLMENFKIGVARMTSNLLLSRYLILFPYFLSSILPYIFDLLIIRILKKENNRNSLSYSCAVVLPHCNLIKMFLASVDPVWLGNCVVVKLYPISEPLSLVFCTYWTFPLPVTLPVTAV